MIEIMSQVEYKKMLENIQNYVAANYSDEVAALRGSDDHEAKMKEIIKRSLIKQNYYSSFDDKLKRAVNLLYEDMAGMSFLAKYLRNINKIPDLEEININSWNSIDMLYSGNITKKTEETFLSPKHAVDIIRNILAIHGDTIDNSEPGVVSYITENIRITAFIAPIIDESLGVVASIRITRPEALSSETLIEQGTVSREIVDFILTCAESGVSMAIGGKMGAGKTCFLNYILAQLPDDSRDFLIEEGSRECKLAKYDENGRMINQVISALTKPTAEKRTNFDASKLLEMALRFNADYIIPQEMRSGEAYVATEAARTGSTVISTIHSNGAEYTYTRIMTLEQKVSDQSDSTLMKLAVEAFPLSVYMKKCKDGVRRVMEVCEAVSYTQEKGLDCRTIYRFEVEDNILDENGKVVKVKGQFKKINGISKRLQRILSSNGVEKRIINQYAASGEERKEE